MHPVRCAALCAIGMLAVSAARADPFWLYQRNAFAPQQAGQVYFGPVVQGGVQQIPTFKSLVSFFANTAPPRPFLSVASFDGDATGAQPGGIIGYVFPDGTMPRWLGQRVRIEFEGRADIFTARRSVSSTEATAKLFHISAIGGGPPLAAGVLAAGRNYTEEFRFERAGYGLDLRATADHPLTANFVVSPSIGVFGGQLFDHHTSTTVIGGSTGVLPSDVNERVRTNAFGFALAAAASWQFAPGWSLRAAGSAGGVWLHSRLAGTQCETGASVAPGTPCGPSNPAFKSSSVEDSRSVLGFRGTASLAVSADMRFALATLGGFFRYDSHIAGVDNPQPQAFGAGVQSAPARLYFKDGVAYGGFLRFVIPIGL